MSLLILVLCCFICNLKGKAYTTIQSVAKLNDVIVFPGTGLIMMSNDAPKMQTYYIPVSVSQSSSLQCNFTFHTYIVEMN